MRKSWRNFAKSPSLQVIHRYLGLGAGLWLFVIAASGLFLNWSESLSARKLRVSNSFLTHNIVQAGIAIKGQFLQGNAVDLNQLVLADATGVWHTKNRGVDWQSASFQGDQPSIFCLSSVVGKPDEYWLGTDQGLYRSTDGGASFQPFALQGKKVTTVSVSPRWIHAVVEQSEIWAVERGEASESAWRKLDLGELPQIARERMPGRVGQQYLMDLHFGRGIFGRGVDARVNDLAALGVIILGVTGFLFWVLRKVKGYGKWLRVIRSFHGKWLGVICFFPIILAASTGLLLDHMEETRGLLGAMKLPPAALPPAFFPSQWDGQIETILQIDEADGPARKILVGTRLGLFVTETAGQSWKVLKWSEGNASFVLRRLGNQVVSLGRKTGRSFLIDPQTVKVQSLPMETKLQEDVVDGGDQWLWKNRNFLTLSDGQGAKLETSEFEAPKLDSTPLSIVALMVHRGTFLFEWGNWLNDAMALTLLALLFTGLLRAFKPIS